MSEDNAEPKVKFAMQLSGVDLGHNIGWIHKYKYAGVIREKPHEIGPIHKITHESESVFLYYRDSYRNANGRIVGRGNSVAIKPDVSVIVLPI